MSKVIIRVGKAIILLALTWGIAWALETTEKDKIEYLLTSVEHSTNVKFIRNGSEHSGQEAANHLRTKFQKAGGKVQTAEDFILHCASRSYVSGKPYTVRFPDGTITQTAVYFRDLLKEHKKGIKQEHQEKN